MLQAQLRFFPAKPWNLLFLQESLVPFIREWYLETKVCVLRVLIVELRWHCF